jgi:hypothetical protein
VVLTTRSKSVDSGAEDGAWSAAEAALLSSAELRASTTAPVMTRFARAKGNITFHPDAMSWS